MKTLLLFLKEICNRHLWQEKILIAPSYSAGRQLIEAFVIAGHASLNLHIETIQSLAEGVQERSYRE